MKSIDRKEYQEVLKLLRAVRVEAGIPQTELSERLGRPQPFVSAAELGRVRLDALQLKLWCDACGTDLVAFAQRLTAAFASAARTSRKIANGTPRKSRES